MIRWLAFVQGFLTMIPVTILAFIYFETFKYNGILIQGKLKVIVTIVCILAIISSVGYVYRLGN